MLLCPLIGAALVVALLCPCGRAVSCRPCCRLALAFCGALSGGSSLSLSIVGPSVPAIGCGRVGVGFSVCRSVGCLSTGCWIGSFCRPVVGPSVGYGIGSSCLSLGCGIGLVSLIGCPSLGLSTHCGSGSFGLWIGSSLVGPSICFVVGYFVRSGLGVSSVLGRPVGVCSSRRRCTVVACLACLSLSAVFGLVAVGSKRRLRRPCALLVLLRSCRLAPR